MANYCLDCVNKINGRSLKECDVILSKKAVYCKNCGEWKEAVEAYRWMYSFEQLMRKYAETEG